MPYLKFIQTQIIFYLKRSLVVIITTNYVKATKNGSKFGNIAPNMIWAKNHWSKYNKILPVFYGKREL